MNAAGTFAVLTLSERNLRSLLAKLGDPASQRTLVCGDCWRDGQPVDDLTVLVRCERDERHYDRRAEPPGSVHPRTEMAIELENDPACSESAPSPSEVRRTRPLALGCWIFRQGQVWNDRDGKLKRIERMSLDDVRDALVLFTSNAATICHLVAAEGRDHDAAAIDHEIAVRFAEATAQGRQHEPTLLAELNERALEWLWTQPLLEALQRRWSAISESASS